MSTPNRVYLLYAIPMTDTPPRKKPGKPLRFPARVLAHVTAETKQQLQDVAERRQLDVPDVIREYIRQGLERDQEGAE